MIKEFVIYTINNNSGTCKNNTIFAKSAEEARKIYSDTYLKPNIQIMTVYPKKMEMERI